MRGGVHACIVALTVASPFAALADRPVLPDAPLHDRTVLDERPALRFISVSPALATGLPKPGVISFSIPADANTRISRLVGMPYGEIALYRRAPRVGEREIDKDAPWETQIVAALNPRNVKGNVMFVLYDRADPTAQARRAYTALWEATMDPFRIVAAQITLDPNAEGVHATHTYLLRIVQLWNQREVVLAQGTFRLE